MENDKDPSDNCSQTVCQVLRIIVRLDQFGCEDCDKEFVKRHILMNHVQYIILSVLMELNI